MKKMFRGRRPRRRGIITRLIGQAVNPLFNEANHCLETGDYACAAERFEQLALSARPRNAGHLYVAAGRARLLAGQEQPSALLFRRGLATLAERGRWITVHRLGKRVVQMLREQGMSQPADEINAWLRGQPGYEQAGSAAAPASGPASAPARMPRLPLKCPSCGGTLDPRDLEWVDQFTIECDYCGGLVRAEEG
jgi:hypothetical protein